MSNPQDEREAFEPMLKQIRHDELIAELEWCLKNGTMGHRTYTALAEARAALATQQAGQRDPLWPVDGVYPDMQPPATSRDRWMFDQGRLAERRIAQQAVQWKPPPLTCPRSNRSDCELFGAKENGNG